MMAMRVVSSVTPLRRSRPAAPMSRSLREGAVALDTADLDAVLRVEARAPLFLRLYVLGVQAPGAQRLLGLELDDRDPLPILGDEALVGNVAGHLARELAHARGPARVLLPRLGPDAGTEDGNDHGSPGKVGVTGKSGTM